MSKKTKQHRFAPKVKIKKGDTVQVIAGAYKGDTGEVLEVMPDKNRAVVDGINLNKKHVKPTQNDEGGIREIASSIHISNLMLVDPSSNEPTRVGRRVNDEGQLERYAKKSGKTL